MDGTCTPTWPVTQADCARLYSIFPSGERGHAPHEGGTKTPYEASMARAGSLKDVCVSSQLGVFFGWVFFLEGGLGYTRHSGVTYAVVVGIARTGERGGEGAVGHQGCAQKRDVLLLFVLSLSHSSCTLATMPIRTISARAWSSAHPTPTNHHHGVTGMLSMFNDSSNERRTGAVRPLKNGKSQRAKFCFSA